MYPLEQLLEETFWPRDIEEVCAVKEFVFTSWQLLIDLSPVDVVDNMFPEEIGVTKMAVVEDGTTGCWCFNKLCGCFDWNRRKNTFCVFIIVLTYIIHENKTKYLTLSYPYT